MTWLQAVWKATLIVVAVGVALMHSTGHACTDDVCHSASSAIVGFEPHSAVAGQDGGDGHHDHPFGSGMNPMQVCMAILTGLALAVSLWAIRRLTRKVVDDARASRFQRASGVVPISPPPGGRLSFIELSVFRI